MAEMYDSYLFSGLEGLLGHDPDFYEESDVSSPHGDIRKSFLSTSSPVINEAYANPDELFAPLQSSPLMSDAMNIDSLLSEGNQLLDELMASNGLNLASSPVDLLAVDELAPLAAKPPPKLVADDLPLLLQDVADYSVNHLPESPVSTLPSEPSSPLDLNNVDGLFADSPVQHDLDELLSDILDNSPDHMMSLSLDSELADSSHIDTMDWGSCSQFETTVNGHMYQPVSSPTQSESSKSWSGESVCSDVSSEYVPVGKAPGKAKKKKSGTPYSKLPAGRKERKKLQNKEAAIRYRQKKKSETQELASVEDELLSINKELKNKVLTLEREMAVYQQALSDCFNVHSYR